MITFFCNYCKLVELNNFLYYKKILVFKTSCLWNPIYFFDSNDYFVISVLIMPGIVACKYSKSLESNRNRFCVIVIPS